MAASTTPMLFIPPRPPLQIQPNDRLLVGRSRGCELQLPDGDASRRHAEIVPDEEGFLLRDLASTNGTFVNGERVREHRLRPGDRIQIGSSTITFCQVHAPLEGADRSDDKTILVERPVAGDVFQGDLAQIPAFAVLQILEMGRKTGVLHVDAESGAGRLWFEGGRPVHADTKGQTGFDAALSLVNAATGRFTFEPQAQLPDSTITASVTELLLEASRLLDEGGLG